jgi:hypothetical protein
LVELDLAGDGAGGCEECVEKATVRERHSDGLFDA